MSKLANMFLALRLDAENSGEDDRAEVAQASASAEETASREPDKTEENDTIAVNNEEGTRVSSSGDYRMPLVWIDLEMTESTPVCTPDYGDRFHCVSSTIIFVINVAIFECQGPDLVISQSKDCLDNMDEWCKTHHSASGLTERVLQSELSEGDAEAQVLNFVKRHVSSGTPLLAGNSVYVDLLFLKKYMPQLAAIFSHVIVDVSSVMALCIRWYPKERKQTPRKQKAHRAMDDIKESIAELKYYKDNIFKPQKSKR
ncbi:Oligoribonuclease [Dichanthelium oligosanthes]|uniref:Oligoribonuclease n=1 Tax=Dichanthelium oligosanthes TaxID=888268 RepID=A0A1E5VDI1_9POAL|nr:Oligoribonuclease [Dichanthelium oligosanthes]